MDEVRRLRVRHDPARSRFPIEITVAGSSGLGWFSEGQSPSLLSQRVGELARGLAPFSFRFEKLSRFPDSSVYYFAPRDESPFCDFQRRLAACGLRFESTPYDYVPHCTVAILAPGASTAAHAEMQACPVPARELRVSSVSFWSVDQRKQLPQQGEQLALGA